MRYILGRAEEAEEAKGIKRPKRLKEFYLVPELVEGDIAKTSLGKPMNTQQEFTMESWIGIILLAEKTPSSGVFISCGNVITCQF